MAGEKSIPRSYMDLAVGLQMPLVRIISRQISWADMEAVCDAIETIEWLAARKAAEASPQHGEVISGQAMSAKLDAQKGAAR